MAELLACCLCGKSKFNKKNGMVRDNRTLKILECLSCGLVFLSSFDHIKKNFYEQSQMHSDLPDIKDWLEETARDDDRRFNFLKSLIDKKSVLDFGCGPGGFLERAKARASRASGVEIEERLSPYFLEKGLEVFSDIDKITDNFDVITLFHVLEHMKDPVATLNKLSCRLNTGGQIIVEVPSADDALLKFYENTQFSEFTYWSCHLFLFTSSTIALLAKKSGLNVNYIKQVQRYPLSNHLYWLAKGRPGGHKIWGFLDSEEINKAYEKQLTLAGICDTIIASFSKR